jgi:hypothetical protein
MSVHFGDNYINHLAIAQLSDTHKTCEPFPGVHSTDETSEGSSPGFISDFKVSQ